MTRLNKRFPIYSKLLYLYPADYRMQYGQQMLQTLADMLDDLERSKFAIWSRTILDFLMSVVYQQISFSGEVMKDKTPDYVKRNALTGAVLLAPFFTLVLVSIVSGHTLPNSQDWRRFYWVTFVVLPLVAFALNILALLRWVSTRRKHDKITPLKSLFAIRYNWPALLVGGLGLLLALFLPLHDSVHCVTGNPAQKLRNWHQTWECIQRG